MSSRYSIKDLERISGIKAHTLRIWEQRYHILHPRRTDTNIRYYSGSDLKKILNISLLNNNGYKISNIARLNEEKLLGEVEKFLSNYKSESGQVESLLLCLMDMNEERFEKTINNAVAHFGFENTIEKVVFPFLKHLGDLWQVGVINAAQEHYISNLIRQKLIVGLDTLVVPPNSKAKKFMFFLPNGELHELSLLYLNYLVKARGHEGIYLGQSVPFEDLVGLAGKVKPDVMVTVFTASMIDVNVNTVLKKCHESINAEFLISGRLVVNPDEKLVLPSEKFKAFDDFTAFKKLI